MNIIIEDKQNFEILSQKDLERIIPSSLKGKVLNYGQGEGQVEIDGTVGGYILTQMATFYSMKKVIKSGANLDIFVTQ